MSNRTAITLLIYGMAQAVLFGAGLILVVATPLSSHAAYSISAVVLISALISAPLAWKIAPVLRARHQRRHAREEKLGSPTPN